MKQSQEVEAIKREIANYNFYKKRLKALNELREICYSSLGGYRSPQFDKEPIHAPPNKDVEYRIRDEISRLDKLIEFEEYRIAEVENVLNKVPFDIKEALIKNLVNNKSNRKIADENYIAYTTLLYRVNQALKKALED